MNKRLDEREQQVVDLLKKEIRAVGEDIKQTIRDEVSHLRGDRGQQTRRHAFTVVGSILGLLGLLGFDEDEIVEWIIRRNERKRR